MNRLRLHRLFRRGLTDGPLQTSFRKNVLLLAGGTVIAQGLMLLVSPILTRIYTPEAFGIHGVYTSWLLILISGASLRYEAAIPVATNEDDASQLLILCLAIVVGIAGLVFAAAVILPENWRPALGVGELGGSLWLLSVGVLFGGGYQVLSAWMVRRGDFVAIARTRASQSVFQSLIQIAAGLFSPTAAGLIVGEIAGRSSGTVRLSKLTLAHLKQSAAKLSLRRVYLVAAYYRKFPLISGPSTVINTAGLRIPALFMAVIYGSVEVGWLALAQRVIAVPLSLIGQSVAQVYLNEGARIAREQPSHLPRFFYRQTARLFGVASVVALGAAVASPVLFPVVFGEAWRSAGLYAAILAPMLLAQLSVSPLSQTIVIIGRQGLQLWWDVARFIVLVGVFTFARFGALTAVETVALYSATMVVMYGVLFLTYRHALNSFVKEF